MRSSSKLMTLGLMGLFALVSACSDSTGPGSMVFSAESAVEDYQAMDAIVNSSDWDDFRVASAGFSFGGGSGVPAALNETLDNLNGLRSGDGEELARSIIDNMGEWDISGQAVISEVHRGVTFAWDEVVEDYVATELTGAPATGVRFILYESDANDVPIVANEIGFVDLIDEGDAIEPIALRLSATANDVNFLDYRVELSNPEAGAASLAIDGFLRNDTDQLDFDIDVLGSATPGVETVDITFNASIDTRDFDVALVLSGVNDETGETGAVTLTVTHGANSLVVDATVTDGVMDGTISLNGELFATMTGDPDAPTFNSADGDGLTTDEIQMLGEVGQMAERVFTFFGELMEPAMHIILIGILL